jgi:choline kinase
MKALILAAGRGTRISRYLEGNPKCTVNIGGTSLIRYTIELLNSFGINDIGIVLGYRKQIIRTELADMNVQFFENPFFDVTNSIASAWFSHEFLTDDDDILIMNGDVYLDREIMPLILNTTPDRTPLLFADETRREEADYKFCYRDGILLKYGKELTGDDITGEYIGVARLSRTYLPRFREKLMSMIDEQKHSVWWENVLYELSHESAVYVAGTEGKFWAEVDYVEDYERILSHRGYSLSNILPNIK